MSQSSAFSARLHDWNVSVRWNRLRPEDNYSIRLLIAIGTEWRFDETSFLASDRRSMKFARWSRRSKDYVTHDFSRSKINRRSINLLILKAPFTSFFRCEPLIFARDILSSSADKIVDRSGSDKNEAGQSPRAAREQILSALRADPVPRARTNRLPRGIPAMPRHTNDTT